jgi:hypothetical protein
LTAHEGGRSVGAAEKLSGGSKVELTTPSTLAETTVRLVTEQPLIKICDDMELERTLSSLPKGPALGGGDVSQSVQSLSAQYTNPLSQTLSPAKMQGSKK